MFLSQRRSRMDASGQAAVEYLLTLTVVFIAFAGVSVLFSNQVDHYLSLLFDMIVLPF
jgi:Flp pilus assembly pilin Flp